jgi:integrase
MILLGINCGFGNHDCATLPISALDLERGWVTHPRPKTEVHRRCRLWPETVKALQEVLTRRPQVPFDAVFVTKYSQPWTPKSNHDDPIGKEMTKLLKSLSCHRPGLGFYALRHTFETVAGECRDQVAVDFIMGHSPRSDDMSAIYRERMTKKRLKRVVSRVRKWLFNSTSSQKAAIAPCVPAFESCASPETAPSLDL